MRRTGGAANGSEGAGASESWRLPRAWPGGARAACDRRGRVSRPSWGRVRLPHQQKRAADLRWSSSAHSECLTCGRARYNRKAPHRSHEAVSGSRSLWRSRLSSRSARRKLTSSAIVPSSVRSTRWISHAGATCRWIRTTGWWPILSRGNGTRACGLSAMRGTSTNGLGRRISLRSARRRRRGSGPWPRTGSNPRGSCGHRALSCARSSPGSQSAAARAGPGLPPG